MKIIKRIIFGQRVQGEKLPEPTLPPEREMNWKDFQKWCNELRVSSQYGRQTIHI